MKKTLLFIYGTVKRNMQNHNVIEGRCKYKGDAILLDYAIGNLYNNKTVSNWESRSGGLPILVRREGMYAKGELYKISNKALYDLDLFEGNGVFYERKPITINKGGKQLKAMAYFPTKDTENMRW